MNAVSYTDLRQNIVLLSIEEYNSLMETNYLLGSEENYKYIKESIDQYEKGKAIK